jgi:hypothetical protein
MQFDILDPADLNVHGTLMPPFHSIPSPKSIASATSPLTPVCSIFDPFVSLHYFDCTVQNTCPVCMPQNIILLCLLPSACSQPFLSCSCLLVFRLRLTSFALTLVLLNFMLVITSTFADEPAFSLVLLCSS